MLLLEGRPSFVYSTCDAADQSECLDWLAVSLQDVYESAGGGVGGGAVPGRSGADVLNSSGLAWTRGRRAVGSPPVEVEFASMTVPQKAGSLAACPGGGGGGAPSGPPAILTLELLLAGQDFNVTTLPGNDRTRTEVLAGNAKWTLTAEHWCGRRGAAPRISLPILPLCIGDESAAGLLTPARRPAAPQALLRARKHPGGNVWLPCCRQQQRARRKERDRAGCPDRGAGQEPHGGGRPRQRPRDRRCAALARGPGAERGPAGGRPGAPPGLGPQPRCGGPARRRAPQAAECAAA